MFRKFLTSLAGRGKKVLAEAREPVGVARPLFGPRHVGAGLLLQGCSSFVGQLQRLGVLTRVVELLGLVELSHCLLYLWIVRLHLGGGVPRLLDNLGTRARERGAAGEGQRDRYSCDCHELSHVLSPPSCAGWLSAL